MKTTSLIVIATSAFGIACSAHPAGVEGLDAASPGTSEEALTSDGWPLAWSALPNHANGFTASPAVARIFDDTIEVIARDAVTNTLRRSRKVGHTGAWSSWASLGSDTFVGKPVVFGLEEDFPTTTIASIRYVVLARKSDNRFYSRYMRGDGTALSGWVQVAADTFASSPGVATAGRVMWIVGRKSNGSLYAASQTLGGWPAEQYSPTGFGAFAALPAAPAGTQFAGDPAVSGASFWESGGPAFYSRLNDNRYATAIGYTNNTHSSWSPIGATTFASDPAVTSSHIVGRTTVFGRKLSNPSTNRIVQATGFHTAWEPFTEVKTDTFVEGPAAIDGTDKYGGPNGSVLMHHVVAKKSNNQLYLNSHVNTDRPFGPRQACKEPDDLRKKAPVFSMVVLPPGGELQLSLSQSITWDELKNVALDTTPPVLGTPNPAYSAALADDAPAGQAPFLAQDIQPFRHTTFVNEFMIGGWHTFGADDYATTKGFRYLNSYARNLTQQGHLPTGTRWAKIVGHDWNTWMTAHGLAPERWDQVADLDLVGMLTSEGFLAGTPAESILMLDLEPWVRSLDQLRQAPFYPTDPAQQPAFEERYYRGAKALFIAPVDVAHARGWSYVSVYGWSPFPRTFWGLESAVANPETDFAWNAYGKDVYDHLDGINNSVYSFYWSPANLAYTLANIDLNFAMIAQKAVKKPIRPYYWTALHGGGGGWRWWKDQPAMTEEMRAISAMGFFTGFDGRVQWDWTGTGNYSIPPAIAVGGDLMLKSGFVLTPEAPPNTPATTFSRYDVIHVNSIDANGVVHFQRIDKSIVTEPFGITPDKPSYALASSQLTTYLRARSEPMAGVFQGMALVKPFEQTLRHGAVKIDVSAQLQVSDQRAVVRRVKRHGVHILVSNSPKAVYGGPAEEVVLQNFDGKPGRTLRVPADAETRVWVLTDASCY